MVESSAIVVIIAIIGLLVIAAIVFFKLCYVDVPQSTALIIDNKKVVFTGAIVLPYQKKQLIKIVPVQVKVAYLGKNGLYSQDHLLMDVIISYTLNIDPTSTAILSAIDLVGAEQLGDAHAVSIALADVLKETATHIVQQYDYELLDKDRGKLRKALTVQLTNKLQGYSLTFINIDKLQLMPLQDLAKQDSNLAKQQQDIRLEWDKEQKLQLEKRLKLVLNQQRELSCKIKKMIEDYQAVISKKIKFFLHREIS